MALLGLIGLLIGVFSSSPPPRGEALIPPTWLVALRRRSPEPPSR